MIATPSLRIGGLAMGVLIALVWLAAEPTRAQGRRVPTPPAPPPSPGAQVARPNEVAVDYKIGPGDLLAIIVFGLPELGQTLRVSNSGKVHISQLGVIKVAGRTTAQLESEVASLLRQKALILDPWVTVKVTEVRAHPVYVLGEVLTPGQFQISNEMYLSDLVTLSNGVNDVASPIGYLYRRKVNPQTGVFEPTEDPDNDQMEGFPVDLRGLQIGDKPELNVKLRGGDILYVPERRQEYFFVIGDVQTPGLFDLTPGAVPLRLSQALARAGGPTRAAKAAKSLLVRYAADGTRSDMPVNLKAVLRGTQPDIEIQFGDVLFVPGSRAKTAAFALLGVIPAVVMGRVVAR
jgi:polysaccharide export outer membrane protein